MQDSPTSRRCASCGQAVAASEWHCGNCGVPMPRETTVLGSGGLRPAKQSAPSTDQPTLLRLGTGATQPAPGQGMTQPGGGPEDATQVGGPTMQRAQPGGRTQPGVSSGTTQPLPPGARVSAPLGGAAPAGAVQQVGQQTAGAGVQPAGAALPPLVAPVLPPKRGRAAGVSGWVKGLLGALVAAVVLEGVLIGVLFVRPVELAALHPFATRTPLPTPTPTPLPGTTLYQANWANGSLDGWVVNDQAGDWHAGTGVLFNDAQNTGDIGTAPSIEAPMGAVNGQQNYAIEATIEVLGYAGCCPGFGFFVGYADGPSPGGYILGMSTVNNVPLSQLRVTAATGWHQSPLQAVEFLPGAAAHHYRIEVRGGQINLFVDGVPLLVPPFDAGSLPGVIIGLWCAQTRLVVSSFVVSTL